MSRYKVIRELGRNQEGGRITYLASDSRLNPPQRVVIKEFRFATSGANWSGFKAYQREIEILRELKHPRIPRYLNSFETKSGFCLVQEYKNAPSLAQRRSFSPEDIKQIAVSVLEILVDLQKRTPPVIHRDIKPENILVDKQLNAYLIDFGFARIRGGELALSSVAAGTPGFMPPEEQFGRPLTEASDLYSLGATLICLLTGTRSLDVGNLIDDDYRFDFKRKVPQLSPSFIAWLEKMVVPNVKQRYPNAAVALEALKPIRVVGGATWQEILGYAVKRRTSVSVVGLAIFGVFVLLGMNLIVSRSEKTEKIENSSPLVASSNQNLQKELPRSNEAVPFHISSLDSPFSYAGIFDGEYRVYPTFIEVSVTKATIYLRDNAPYKGRRQLTSVTFGLVTDTPTGWNIVSRSQSFPVNRVMKPNDTYTLTSARFLIPKNSSTDLSKHWLVVDIESATLDSENPSRGSAYAHSKRNIFLPAATTPKQISPTSETLTTPTQLRPLDGTVFNHFPRETPLVWTSVPGASSYMVEVDFYSPFSPQPKWCSEMKKPKKCSYIKTNVMTNSYTFDFVGKQSGRWRVWAVGADGRESPKSGWWEFRHTR